MKKLLSEKRNCTVYKAHLPFGPKPIIEASPKSKIILISQAPGRVVHENEKAWANQSGNRLREWLGVDEDTFYNTNNFAILPMGFCYPGKAKTGDRPPRKECAPLWHDEVFKQFNNTKLILLIGGYATTYYVSKDHRNLTQRVENFEEYLPKYLQIPHPSPVNRFWRAKNHWFQESVVPIIKTKIATILE